MAERAGEARKRHEVVLFGEVLFDVFPGNVEVLGGAPFNVAWNLRGLGLDPLFISRVGDDDRGRKIVESMESWGLDATGLQRDDERPTGIVEITLEGGGHRFEILPDQAYDHIDTASARAMADSAGAAILYHGTLAARAERSREALSSLRAAPELDRFVDLNLRPPWYTTETVETWIDGARWLKLNDDELAELSGCEAGDLGGLHDAARKMRSRRELTSVFVTRGSSGAFVVGPGDEVVSATPPPTTSVVDTVGAGDAFSAVCLLGLLRSWPPATSLDRAVAFAASVCGLRGATSQDTDFYRHWLGRWGEE